MSALAVMTGCGAGGPDRQGVLIDLAENGIVPVYQELGVSVDDLSTAVADLCAEPDPASLATAREALVDARTIWSTSEPMWVGPVMERRSWAVIDWPIETDEIESLIADTTVELDEDRLANRIGADQRSLQAVEYILGDDDTVVIEQLDDPRRCVFLTGIVDVMADEAQVVLADWTAGDGGEDDDQAYVATFSAGDSSGLDSIVNDALFLLEAMSDAELGTALGQMEASADPEAVVEGPAGLATADVAAHLTGLRVVLVGDGRTSGIGHSSVTTSEAG